MRGRGLKSLVKLIAVAMLVGITQVAIPGLARADECVLGQPDDDGVYVCTGSGQVYSGVNSGFEERAHASVSLTGSPGVGVTAGVNGVIEIRANVNVVGGHILQQQRLCVTVGSGSEVCVLPT